MGNRLLHEKFEFPGLHDNRAVPAILATVGLAHDLGNPPFGHQGEAAIGHWFSTQDVFEDKTDPVQSVATHLHEEFLAFEGNAQAFRLLTHLQVALGGHGLDLTAGTLAALMKYPTTSDCRSEDSCCTKKYGYFESEHKIVEWVRTETGLQAGQRHPLTWIMEAADDIAYSTLDIEDAIHKGIISPDDVLAIIEHHLDGQYKELKKFLKDKFKLSCKDKFSIKETKEIMSSYLRTGFIQNLLNEAMSDYVSDKKSIFEHSRNTPLMKKSPLLKCLKNIAKQHVFVDPSVRKIEADGYRIIGGLMDFYWYAITNRKYKYDLTSQRKDAKSAFGISKISDNYLHAVNRTKYIGRDGSPLPPRYKELRLLTDMVSGMSDGFAKAEFEFLMENQMI